MKATWIEDVRMPDRGFSKSERVLSVQRNLNSESIDEAMEEKLELKEP